MKHNSWISKHLYRWGKRPSSSVVRRAHLGVEPLESRDLLNVAPTLASLLFDKSTPHTNDTLHVQVLEAADADGDPLVFQMIGVSTGRQSGCTPVLSPAMSLT
jgi:hypothetical protein